MLAPNIRKQQHSPTVATPFSREIGDTPVPYNVAATVFRYRAPETVTIKNPCIYCGEIISPTGAPIQIEAWKNGQFGGNITIENGANRFDSAITLQGLELLELKVVAKTTQTDSPPTTIKDLWIMWSR